MARESNATVAARMKRWREAKRVLVEKPQREKKPPRKLARARDFWGIDGEGITTPGGDHRYMLMCAGDDVHTRELYTGKELTTEQCLEFILSLPADVTLVGFSFGYDVTKILQNLNPERRRDLLTDKSPPKIAKLGNVTWLQGQRKSPYTYWRGEYGLEYLPGNYLRVCRIAQHKKTMAGTDIEWITSKPVPGSVRTIYEAFGFFQKKFAQSLDDFAVGTKKERKLIAKNKAERAVFHRVTREIRRYCALECALLARMMGQLRSAAYASGIYPRTWNGAGKFASALHTSRHTMTKADVQQTVPSPVWDHAEAAYYGGRFECPRVGFLPGPVFEYDINSAYPAAMRELPCLVHGRWEYLDGGSIRAAYKRGALLVADVAYAHREPCRGMCGLPHRHGGDDRIYAKVAGSLCWPVEGRGVYWSPELRSAEKLGARFSFASGWVYRRECECVPFDWIEPLYLERKRLGKSTAGYPLKLAINALYGKLAQRVGNPRWQNPIWAGLTTAITRAKLNDAVAANPDIIAMIATDGIYCLGEPRTSLNPLGLHLSDDLGGWELTRHETGLFVVQPGLYWGENGGEVAKLKTRGMSRGFFQDKAIRRRFERAWEAFRSDPVHETARDVQPAGAPSVMVPLRLFVGLRQAAAWGKDELAGQWQDSERELSFKWGAKRVYGRWQEGPHVKTLPIYGNRSWRSAVYNPEAGLMEGDIDAIDGLDEQPDAWLWLTESD